MSTPRIELKHRSGWFAAGPEMLTASRILSDGAFKLFVYLCLNASRHTGRLEVRNRDLSRALSKSRRSVTTYIEELSGKGVCQVLPSINQHQTGEIEIQDDFWPYCRAAPTDSVAAELSYIQEVKRRLLAYPQVRSTFTVADHHLASELYRSGVSLRDVERAFLLGISRKHISYLNSKQESRITSLKYFLPLIEEVQQVKVSDNYWVYLRLRLHQLGAFKVTRSNPDH